MKRRGLIATAASSMAAGFSGCIGVSTARTELESVSASFPASEVDQIEVTTTGGSIDIVSEERTTVSIEGEKAAATTDDLAATELVTTLEAWVLSVEVDADDVDNSVFGIQTRPTPSIDLEVAVPASVQVYGLSTTTGEVSLTDVGGPVAVDGVTDYVALHGIADDVEVQVTTGDVRVWDVAGDVRVETTTGDSRIESIGGDVVVATSTGDIHTVGIDESVTIE